MQEDLALAQRQLGVVKGLCTQVGLHSLDIPATFIGVGVGVGFTQTGFVVLSVTGYGGESTLRITSGILKDMNHDRLAALDAANLFNQSNTAFPVYLHDADVGWSPLAQLTYPIHVMTEVPSFFDYVVRSLPGVVQEYRATLAEKTTLGGGPWEWNDADVNALLLRSMV